MNFGPALFLHDLCYVAEMYVVAFSLHDLIE